MNNGKNKNQTEIQEHWVALSDRDALTLACFAKVQRQRLVGEELDEAGVAVAEELDRYLTSGATDARGDQSLAFLMSLTAEQLTELEQTLVAALGAAKSANANEGDPQLMASPRVVAVKRIATRPLDGGKTGMTCASTIAVIKNAGRPGAIAAAIPFLATGLAEAVVVVPPPMNMISETLGAMMEGSQASADLMHRATHTVPGCVVVLQSALGAWVKERGGWPAGVPTVRDVAAAIAPGGHPLHAAMRKATPRVLIDAAITGIAQSLESSGPTMHTPGGGEPSPELVAAFGDTKAAADAWMRSMHAALGTVAVDARDVREERVAFDDRERWRAECAALIAADSMEALVNAVGAESKARKPEGGAT